MRGMILGLAVTAVVLATGSQAQAFGKRNKGCSKATSCSTTCGQPVSGCGQKISVPEVSAAQVSYADPIPTQSLSAYQPTTQNMMIQGQNIPAGNYRIEPGTQSGILIIRPIEDARPIPANK